MDVPHVIDEANDERICRHPKSFKCRIRPRSEKAVKLIRDTGVLLGVE